MFQTEFKAICYVIDFMRCSLCHHIYQMILNSAYRLGALYVSWEHLSDTNSTTTHMH